jgi:hypothetical protein
MVGRRFVVFVGTVALVAPLTGWTSMPAEAAPAVVPASVCFPSTDNGDPDLKSFTISPRAVDSRDGAKTVTFTATAEDTGGPGAPSGVTGATAFISFDDMGNWNLSAKMTPDSTGALVGTLTVLPQFWTATRYVSLSLADAAGNTSTYSTSELDRLGFPTTLTTTTTPDMARPALTSLRVSTSAVDTRQRARAVTVTVRATDDSAVGGVLVSLNGLRGFTTPQAELRLVSGTAKDGTWRGRITVGRWKGTANARLGVEITDILDNYRSYGAKRLAELGQPNRLRVTSRTEPELPSLRVRSVTPSSVDLRTGVRSFTVIARVRDVGSGVRKVVAHVDGPESGNGGTGAEARLALVSGTRRDGIWKGTLTLRPCRAEPGEWRAVVFAWDVAEGDYVQLAEPLTVVNDDILRPTAELTGDYYQVRRHGPLTVAFAEDVVGVDSTNALVHVGDGRRGTAGDDPTPLAGTWACKDGAGASVDCSAGPVRTAAFTPASLMLQATNHTLMFNPEHHLGLTDLAGNPYQPSYGLGFHTG